MSFRAIGFGAAGRKVYFSCGIHVYSVPCDSVEGKDPRAWCLAAGYISCVTQCIAAVQDCQAGGVELPGNEILTTLGE